MNLNYSSGIKNIIFDFGGVIFNIDHTKVEQAFKDLGIKNFEALYNQASQSKIFQQFEVGQISAEDFRNQLREITGVQVSDEELDNTWNSILDDFPPYRIDLLNEIKNNYRLFLLSNTNIIHYEYYTGLFLKEFGYDFNTLFEEAFWTFKIGKRKPDNDPYLHILEKKNLLPEETLFIDDSVQNVQVAEKLNIFAYHLKEGEDVTALFENGLLKEELIVRQ